MRAFAIALLVGLGLIVASSTVASAATITEPSGKTIQVGIDEEGYAAATTVKAGGFEPYQSVFIEMCNGRRPTDESWTPTIDCDLGSSPAAAVADQDGNVTFAADDPNHALFPFVGPGPQELFQCFAAGAEGPARAGIESYTNCQLRVSTSNNEATTDQVFVAVALPKGAKTGWQTPTFPKVPAAGAQAGAGSAPGAGAQRSATSGSKASTRDAATASDSSSSGSSSDGFPVLPVVLSVVIVAAGGATVLVLRKRRTGGVAA